MFFRVLGGEIWHNVGNWIFRYFSVIWYIFFSSMCFSTQEINYDSSRGGVSVITEKGDITTSYLLIQRARSSDSGQYTCSPSNANSKSVNVHILAGELQQCSNNVRSIDWKWHAVGVYQWRCCRTPSLINFILFHAFSFDVIADLFCFFIEYLSFGDVYSFVRERHSRR